MQTRKNRKKTLAQILNVPAEVSQRETKITVLGFKKMLIENYIAILEYQDFYIRVKTKIGLININGFNMKLDEMNTDDVMIIGDIDSIDFEKIKD